MCKVDASSWLFPKVFLQRGGSLNSFYSYNVVSFSGIDSLLFGTRFSWAFHLVLI